MGRDGRPDLRQDALAARDTSPFAPAEVQQAAASVWAASPTAAAPAATAAHPSTPAAAAEAAASPGVWPSFLDGAQGTGSPTARGLTSWNFAGRDGHSGKFPTQAELDKDPAWHYCDPAKGGLAAPRPEGRARNLGHMALDVVPHWLGGPARSDEGSSDVPRPLGPDGDQKDGAQWDGVKRGVGSQLARVGQRIAAGSAEATGWSGVKPTTGEPPHER